MNTNTLTRDIQSVASSSILNTVRIVGTAGYAVVAAVLVIWMWATLGDNAGQTFLIWTGIVGCVILGALFYGIVGWFVDTLRLLSKIEANTRIF